MEMETETGGTQPPAQGHLEPQELEEAGKTLPAACGGSRAPGHLDLRHLVSRTGGDTEFLCFQEWGAPCSEHPGKPRHLQRSSKPSLELHLPEQTGRPGSVPSDRRRRHRCA